MKKFTLTIVAAFVALTMNAQSATRLEQGAKLNFQGIVKAPREVSKMTSAPLTTDGYTVITEQPAGTLVNYTRSGSYLYAENNQLNLGTQSGTTAIVYADDNQTVYIKDQICDVEADTWVKGTISGNKITVPVGQAIYYSEQYNAYVITKVLNFVNGEGFSFNDATEVTYTIGESTIELDGFPDYSKTLGAVWTDDDSYLSYGEFLTVFTDASSIEHGQYTFEDGTLGSFTTIDADGDGYTWEVKGYGGHASSQCASSGSYDNNVGALTPDNYLVSPKVALGGKMTFYACAQDASYPAEVFNVAVSTAGNTSASDFTNVWATDVTMTASREASNRAQGAWYKFEVDLSAFAGQEGYVAIRHYKCTDWFFLNVDDITIETSTGINNVKMGKDGKAVWYNLNGTRANNPSKGIFIQNGKKVVVK